MSLERKTPLKRTGFANKGGGFKRKSFGAPTVEQPLGEKVPKVVQPLAKPVNYGRFDGPVVAVPKDGEYRSTAVMAMAKGRDCKLMAAPGLHDPATVVACHSNWGVHGKGERLKAHDCFTVWGCFTCHSWLDQGGVATGEQKREAFDAGMRRQVLAWRKVAADPSEPERFRNAANDALAELERRPAGRVYL